MKLLKILSLVAIASVVFACSSTAPKREIASDPGYSDHNSQEWHSYFSKPKPEEHEE